MSNSISRQEFRDIVERGKKKYPLETRGMYFDEGTAEESNGACALGLLYGVLYGRVDLGRLRRDLGLSENSVFGVVTDISDSGAGRDAALAYLEEQVFGKE